MPLLFNSTSCIQTSRKETKIASYFHRPVTKIDFDIGPTVPIYTPLLKKAILMLMMKGKQRTTLRVRPTDDYQNPATLDSVPEWSVSDDTILSVTPADDGLSAVVRSTGKMGNSQVNVTADAREGEEVNQITGTLEVQVQSGEATSFNIEAGTVEEDTTL